MLGICSNKLGIGVQRTALQRPVFRPSSTLTLENRRWRARDSGSGSEDSEQAACRQWSLCLDTCSWFFGYHHLINVKESLCSPRPWWFVPSLEHCSHCGVWWSRTIWGYKGVYLKTLHNAQWFQGADTGAVCFVFHKILRLPAATERELVK